jgi:hypothetical protein
MFYIWLDDFHNIHYVTRFILMSVDIVNHYIKKVNKFEVNKVNKLFIKREIYIGRIIREP